MTLSRSLMKKALAASLAVATVGATMAATTGSAEAYWRRGGWGWRGPGVAAGVIGGLAAGALIAGAARPAYAAPVYSEPYYYDGPAYDGYQDSCYVERRKVWIDHVRWTYRNVRVCE